MFRKNNTFKRQPHLTQEDIERLKRISENEQSLNQKFKAIVTYNVNSCNQDICITLYGKSKEDLLNNANEHLQNFQNKDKSWKISKIEWLKNDQIEESI